MSKPISLAQVDAALHAWFASLGLIGGLKPHQQERYRAAMEAALNTALSLQAAEDGAGSPQLQHR